MGQSLVQNYLHIIFSTKNRQPLILEPWEKGLYGYMGAVCKALDCQPVRVGGFRDHIHILCMLSKKITLVDLVKEVKINSSKWMKSNSIELRNFYWQHGFGVFSINPSQVDALVDYIDCQHIHHRTNSFQEEYRDFLRQHKVDYNEQYVWD